MSEETGVDAEMMMAGVEQMEEGEVELPRMLNQQDVNWLLTQQYWY